MVVDSGVFGEFECQVRNKYIGEVQILGEDLCKSLFGNLTGFLRLLGRMDVEQERVGQRIGTN